MAYIPGVGTVGINGAVKKTSDNGALKKTNVTKTVVPGTAGKVTINNGSLSAPKIGNVTKPAAPKPTNTPPPGGNNTPPPGGNNTPPPGGNNTPPPVVDQPAASADDYYQKLLQAKQAGILSEFEANASVIRNNLAKALSDLEAEKAALSPIYQQQLTSIAQNQFATSERTKEIMNQGGWNAGNSGLAVGEQGKIAIGADAARGEALNTYNAGLADINRRNSLTNQTANQELQSLEMQKNAKLAGAESESWLMNQDRLTEAAKAAEDYKLKLASTSASYASKTAADQAKIDAKKIKDDSAATRRSALAQATQAYNKGDLTTLMQLMDAIGVDDMLTTEDYTDLNAQIQGFIDNLKKNSTSGTSTGAYTFRPAGSVYPRQASDYGSGL